MRVLVVEDNALVRAGLLRALETEVDGATVGDGRHPRRGRRATADLSPDVVLLDHVLPDGGGAEAVAELVALAPAAAVVMLTATGSPAVLRTAVEGGAAGFVLKSSGHAAIFDALRAAVRGDAAIGAELLGELLTRAARDPRPVPGEVSAEDRVLLVLLSRGLGIAGAAARLDLPQEDVAERVRAVSTTLGGALDPGVPRHRRPGRRDPPALGGLAAPTRRVRDRTRYPGAQRRRGTAMEGETDDGATGRTIRVLVVDDHELVADSLVRVLSLEDDLVPVGIAPTLARARRWWRSSGPTWCSSTTSCPTGTGSTRSATCSPRTPRSRS